MKSVLHSRNQTSAPNSKVCVYANQKKEEKDLKLFLFTLNFIKCFVFFSFSSNNDIKLSFSLHFIAKFICMASNIVVVNAEEPRKDRALPQLKNCHERIIRPHIIL